MRYLLILLTSFLILSCSSTHEININKDKSATISFNVKNKESLINTVKEWGYIDSEQGEIINTLELKDELSSNDAIEDVIVTSDKDSTYNGTFTISNINEVFNNHIFTLTSDGNKNILKIFLTVDNYKHIKNAISTLRQESIDMLGPEANQDLTREEYLDMISFSLGDQGPQDLIKSLVNLRITVDGDITENSGGELISSNTIEIKIPLLDLILLKRNIEYIIVYK